MQFLEDCWYDIVDLELAKSGALEYVVHFGNKNFDLVYKHRNAIQVYWASEPEVIDYTHAKGNLEKLLHY